MKKLFATATVLISFLVVKEANAQTLQKPSTDSLAIENAEAERWRDTSFHCNFGRDIPTLIVYPGKQNRTGFKNQNMRIVSNRDFRNLNMGIKINGYSYF